MKVLTLLVCLIAFGSVLGSADNRPLIAQPSPAATTASSIQPMARTESAKTFQGRISFMDGRYVLVSATETFQLDNQEKAKPFDGKNVMVTGTLDSATNTILVSDIQAA